MSKLRTSEPGTLLGPLTTAWTMPPTCSVFAAPCPTCPNVYQGQHCVTGAAQDNTDCWPPANSRVASKGYPFLGWGFYSPGVACPTGYTAACTAVYGERPEWPIQFNLFPGETAIGCCPPGFQCGNNDGNTCYANAGTGSTAVISTGVCSGTNIVGIAQATLPFAVTTTQTAVTNGATAVAVKTGTPEFTLWAPMFQYNYKASDLESASRASTASSATTAPSLGLATTSSTSLGPNTSSGASSDASTDGQGGLSTGAIAGIAVGAAIGGILLAAIVGCLWWRRGRKRRDAVSYPAEAPGSSPGTGHWVEADSGLDRNELPTKAAWYPAGEAPELEDRRGPGAGWAYAAELPSGHVGHTPNQGQYGSHG